MLMQVLLFGLAVCVFNWILFFLKRFIAQKLNS